PSDFEHGHALSLHVVEGEITLMTESGKVERTAYIKWLASGTPRLMLCIGRYALKFARSRCGCDANRRERLQWKRATPERARDALSNCLGCTIWLGQHHS